MLTLYHYWSSACSRTARFCLAEAARPRVADWWRRIQARPGFQKAFSFANPNAGDPVKR